MLDAPLDERKMHLALSLAALGLSQFSRSCTFEAGGYVFAEGLAERSVQGVPLCGEVAFKLFREKRIPYDLSFESDSGDAYRLRGQRDFFVYDAIHSLALLPMTLFDQAGREVGRVRLRRQRSTQRLPLALRTLRPRVQWPMANRPDHG